MPENGRNHDDWPYPERRYPTPDSPDYLGAKGLSGGVRRAIAKELTGKSNLKVLDVGCGRKPFYPFFKPFASEYIGTDIIKDSPLIDRVCPAENLDVTNEWADVVTCLSVLEHVDDPIQSVRELYRVVKPDGVVFASTHGCFPWHPYPQDHWRWTQTGLPLLFTRYGGFSKVDIFATRGSLSGIFFLLAHWGYAWASKSAIRRAIRRPLTIGLNRFGEFIDGRSVELSDITRHVTAIPEFFIIARK